MKKLLRILQLIFGILFGIVGAFFSLTILGGIWIAHAGYTIAADIAGFIANSRK